MESEKRIYTCELCGAEFETPGAKGGHKRAHQIKISEEELLAELRRLANVSEQAPTMKMMDEQGAYSAACIRQRFGTWGDALREIGLSPNIKYDIPSTEVKEDIRTIATKLGRPPTSPEYREQGNFSVSLAQNLFGSWNEALAAAGLEPQFEHGIPDDALLDEIRTLVEVLGRSQQRAIWTSTVGFLVGAILIDGTAGRPQFELLATSQLVVHQALPTVTGKRTQRLGDNIMGRTGRPNERRRLSETATYVKRRGVTGHRLPIGRRSGRDCTFTISSRSVHSRTGATMWTSSKPIGLRTS